ncbi:hypothetical protein N8264_03615 [Candidatus Thioglobus sp.]|nr:hypothetical protein [Candidatus Thioglobus sp.]
MKAIFLIDATFSKRDFDRFGIEALVRNNFQVLLWDFSLIRESKLDTRAFEKDFYSKKINRYVFKDFQKLNQKIKELENAFLFDERSAVYKKYNSCWFQGYGAIIVKRNQSNVPFHAWIPSINDYYIILRNSFINDGIIASTLRVLKYINKNLFNNNKECCDIRVCSGSSSPRNNNEFEIRSHSFDFDIYLEEKSKKINSKESIVFLDNGMTSHPDFKKMGVTPYCSESAYFPLLRAFFTKVEKQTGLQVIVSVHPRLIFDKSMNKKFGNRELTSGKTAELVKGAKLVIAHDSTAINFAVLWSTPLLIVTTDQIERRIYYSMEALTQFLRIKRININNSYDGLNFLEIAQEPISQYNHFVDKFIKAKNSPTQNSAEILIKGLQKYVQ